MKNCEEKKKSNVFLWILSIIGICALVAGVVYAVIRYLNPELFDDLDDEFDDDEFEEEDDDEFFEDED